MLCKRNNNQEWSGVDLRLLLHRGLSVLEQCGDDRSSLIRSVLACFAAAQLFLPQEFTTLMEPFSTTLVQVTPRAPVFGLRRFHSRKSCDQGISLERLRNAPLDLYTTIGQDDL